MPADRLQRLAGRLRQVDGAAVLSGAGISVASDIPAFRGEGGLWERYDPLEHAHIDAFRRSPGRVWEMLRELDAVLERARPNAAHRALAELERGGYVTTVITQNVDGLHQAAGSRDVIELHGSRHTLTCLDCGTSVGRDELIEEVRAGRVPRCDVCAGLVKPDVTFFGEQLPPGAMERARAVVRDRDLLLLVGTSGEVHPAAALPDVARSAGTEVWEVDPDPTGPGHRAIALPAEEALPRLVELLAHPRP